MANSIAPGFVKIAYTGASGNHTQTIPVDFFVTPSVGDEPEFKTKAGGLVVAGDAITAYMDAVRPIYHTTVEFQYFEVWYKSTPEADPIFVWADAIGLAGSGTPQQIPASVTTFTFRSFGGGVGKLMFADTSAVLNTVNPFPFPASPQKTLADYVLSGPSWLIARDNTPYAASIKWLTKTHDALRKRLLNL